jgi:hypothetical protein
MIPAADVADLIRARRDGRDPFLVGIAGAVAGRWRRTGSPSRSSRPTAS